MKLLLILCLFVITNVGHAQENYLDSIMVSIEKNDTDLFQKLKSIITKNNKQAVSYIVQKILSFTNNANTKQTNCDTIVLHDTTKVLVYPSKDVIEFVLRRDTLLFTDKIPDSEFSQFAKNRYQFIKAIKQLNIITNEKPDSIVLHINELRSFFDYTNTGDGLNEKRLLSDEQKIYIRPILIKARDIYEQYLEVASSFNPILLNKEHKAKLLSQYKKPLQQAYLKSINTID